MIPDAATGRGPYSSTSPRRSTRTDRLRAALDYAKQGIPVFPIHSVDERGVCTCGGPKANPKCTPGKHPLTPRGHLDASDDPKRINAWWTAHPDANIGVPTGARSGILVLDVDTYKGGAGRDAITLDTIEARRGPIPPTKTVKTGRGGLQLLYRYPKGEEIKSTREGDIGPGMCVKAAGGYVVAPPSFTEGPYEVLKELPLADPPAWLLEALRRPQSPRPGNIARSKAQASAIDPIGEPIPEGTRDTTLASIAGRLHDGTRDLKELAGELLQINANRCLPPLPEAQVLKVAHSIHKKPPCRRTRPEQAPGVDEVLEAAGNYWYERLLRGGGRSKIRDVFRSLMELAARHGELIMVRIAGKERRAVRFSASLRQVAPGAGTSPTSVSRNTRRLRELGALRKDDADRNDVHGGTFLIIEPAHYRYTPSSSSPLGGGKVGEGCNTSARPLRPDRLSTPAPRWGDQVGNSPAGSLYALEAFGPQTEDELAERVGISRPRDLVRRHLLPLSKLGLVEKRGGVWYLSENHRHRTGELRRAPYSTVRRVRRRRRTPEGRILTEVAEVGVVASAEERDRADRARYAAETAAYRDRGRHSRVARPEPLPLARRVATEANPPSGEIGELSPALSPLAEAIDAYLERNPRDAHQRPGWISATLWAYDLYPGRAASQDIEAAIEELGGEAYRRSLLSRGSAA
jgi:putative DNA primase/helicase